MKRSHLLATKLSLPPLRPTLTPRPRLVAHLNGIWQHRLSLLLAPAGFGKTTMLTAWLHQQPLGQVAWLSLDETDNDPARFLAYLWGAVQQADPTLPDMPSLEVDAPLTSLLNHIQQYSSPLTIGLDDYHLLQKTAIHEMMIFVLDNAPPQLHLVIASRVEPPLPLARLRGQGQLLMIEQPDLRFREEESFTFLNEAMQLSLSADDVTALTHRTEGWIAGLQLAGLALSGYDGLSSHFIAQFGGSHRYILDYLATEVLQQQPPEVQHFLLHTAILERLTADLCEALVVTGGRSAQAMLEYLEQVNLFIIPLDAERRWYRYHALFAGFLRHRLKSHQPAELLHLHQQAAAWYEAHDFVAEALSHALEAADVSRATRLIQQVTPRLLSRSELSTLMSWLNALSDQIQSSRTRMSLFQAWALVATGQFERVAHRLQELEQAFSHAPLPNPDLRGEIRAIQGTMAYVQRDSKQAILLYRQAAQELSPQNSFLRGAVALNLGLAYGWTGAVEKSARGLQDAYQLNQQSNRYVASVALWHAAEVQLEQGQRHLAAESYRRILALGAVTVDDDTVERVKPHSFSVDTPLLPDLSGAYIGRAGLLYEENQLSKVEPLLTIGLALSEQATDSIMVHGYITLARLKQAQAKPAAALQVMQEAKRRLYREQVGEYWQQHLLAWEARLWGAQGNFSGMAQWAARGGLGLVDFQARLQAGELHLWIEAYLTLARLLLARQAWAEVTPILADLQRLAEQSGRVGRLIEVMTLQAIVFHHQQSPQQARERLREALGLAQAAGYCRLFLDMGETVGQILRTIDPDEAVYGYVCQLLPHFGSSSEVEPLMEPLSARELEILGLVAAGLSNSRIAETLFLTTGTVKWHVSNIYGKLGVRKRTQAVARARALRLL